VSVLEQLPKGASIAVIRLRSLGDAVLTTPALQLIKKTRPDLRLNVLLDRSLAPLLEGSPAVDRVIVVDRGGPFYAALAAVRAERPALCWNLHGGSTSAWLTAFSGAKFRAGYTHFRLPLVYNVRIPRAQEILSLDAKASVHTAEHHASAAFHLGATHAEIPAAALRAEAPEPVNPPYALLHVAAAYETKRWGAERFLEIGRFLAERRGLRPIVIAGPGDDRLLERFSEFEARPALDLGALKNLAAGASLFVGNDSGPAHVAAAFGVPCAVIFGSSNSRTWRPWGTRSETVETEWDCKPCPGDRCYAFDEPRCILSVETGRVQAVIERLLDAPSQAPSAE